MGGGGRGGGSVGADLDVEEHREVTTQRFRFFAQAIVEVKCSVPVVTVSADMIPLVGGRGCAQEKKKKKDAAST